MTVRKALKLNYDSYQLKLRYPFGVAWGKRETSPVILTRIEYDGFTGFGEASMPPYLGESVKSVASFLNSVQLDKFNDPSDTKSIVEHVMQLAPGNYAAKASVDIALNDLAGKIAGKPLYRIWDIDPSLTPFTSYTIGIDSPEIVQKKVLEADQFRLLKIKLGGGNDKEMVRSVRSITSKPLIADVNQGWRDRHYALDMIHWLKDQGFMFIEQPMPDEMEEDLGWLIEQSPLPVFADEGIRTVTDLERRKGFYNGVNIKLMKCGGLLEARKMISIARNAGMRVMIGCMTETSCAVSAAAQLSPLADYADLDGNLLISNDCFSGAGIEGGKIILNELPGIGLQEKNILQ